MASRAAGRFCHGSASDSGHHRQQRRDACAEPGQGPVLCLALHGHAHGQPVRGHRGIIDAEGQQRRAGQPPERLVNAFRPGGRPGAGMLEQALLPGGVQQRPGHPGRRQQRDHVDQPPAQACRVTVGHRVQGQHDGLGDAVRVRLPGRALQRVLHRHGAQPGQVGRVVQMLGGDHRRGLRQGQRQEPQLARQLPRPGLIGPAGTLGQERQRLLLGEHIDRTARRDPPSPAGCW